MGVIYCVIVKVFIIRSVWWGQKDVMAWTLPNGWPCLVYPGFHWVLLHGWDVLLHYGLHEVARTVRWFDRFLSGALPWARFFLCYFVYFYTVSANTEVYFRLAGVNFLKMTSRIYATLALSVFTNVILTSLFKQGAIISGCIAGLQEKVNIWSCRSVCPRPSRLLSMCRLGSAFVPE